MRTERMALFPELVCDRGESEGPRGSLGVMNTPNRTGCP
jgi:hypothetical protein